mmetsp:Transcript_19793/g.40677  ORF Transcript_19793/g.40677 Transcript_19793/m.40677 type:complete len:326 (-) Transcript_19793:70-1047(-)
MPVQIPYALDREGLAVQFHLVALHDLLDGLADVAQPDVDARGANSRVGGFLDGLQERIVAGVEGHGPRAVDDPPVDLRAEIDFHDVVVLKHGVVAVVGRVVRRHVVERAAGGEADAAAEAVFLDQLAIQILEAGAHVDEFDARPDEALGVVADLAVHFGGVAELVVEGGGEALVVAEFGGGEAVAVGVEGVFLDLAGGEGRQLGGGVIRRSKQVDHGNGGRFRLTVRDVVVGETALAEEATFGFLGRRAVGAGAGAGGGGGSSGSGWRFFLLFLFLLLFLAGGGTFAFFGAVVGSVVVVIVVVAFLVDVGHCFGVLFLVFRGGHG